MPHFSSGSGDIHPLAPADLKECHAILQSAPIGIFASTVDGLFIDANPTLAHLYGYDTPQELIASISDIASQIYVFPENRTTFLEQLDRQGTLISHECLHRRRDGSTFWACEHVRAMRDANGKILYFQGFTTDISARKQAEEALKSRIATLVSPLDSKELAIEQLFALEDLQRLQDEFADACQVASIITRTDGTPVTRPSNFCTFCADLIRGNAQGRINCMHSDTVIGKACTHGPTIQKCLSGGLLDAGAGIVVGNHHIANWLIGQVRDTDQTEEEMLDYVAELGIDREKALAAYRRVPVMSRKRFEKIAQMLYTLSRQLSTTAYQNIQQARFIAEQKQAQKALHQSQKRVKSIFRSAPVGIGVVRDRVITDVNQRLSDMTGYQATEIVGRNSSFLYVDSGEYDFVGREKYTQIQLMGTGTVETRWKKKDGEIIEVLLSSTPIDPSDMSLGATFSALDITERKRSEEALRKSEAKLARNASQMEQFSLSAASMISLEDEHTLFKRICKAIVSFSEYRRVLISLFRDDSPLPEIIGHDGIAEDQLLRLKKHSLPSKEYDQLFSRGKMLGQFSCSIPESNNSVLGQWTTAFGQDYSSIVDAGWHPEDILFVRLSDENGELLGIITAGESRSGRQPTSETVRPLEIYASMISQILILKKEQKRRQTLEKQLHMAQKMESIGRLAGGVAHDFNNMLGVIQGYAEMASEEIENQEVVSEAFMEIQQAARRSSDLTRQLLAFARKQTIAPQILDCNKTLEGMLNMLRRLIGEDINLVWRPAGGLGLIEMDPAQIDQIVANLCVNARDAIGSNMGAIVIETENTIIDETYCAMHAGAVAGDYVLLAVSDNGQGMDQDTLANVFEPFFTTKEVGKGTGLGLATVYGIVKQNNGFIMVYSEKGLGTTFKIYLPRIDATASSMLPAENPPSRKSVQATLLLVEDEPMMLRMTTTILERQGHRVLPAANPGEALQLAYQYSGHIDLLITDVIMPEMNGRTLAEKLVADFPELCCLYMSGYTANAIAHHGVLDEDVHFIQKPFAGKQLLQKIEKILTRSD